MNLPDSPVSSLNLLLLEDRPEDAELIERELSRSGRTPVIRRVAGRDAFLAALDRPPDAVLADFRIPGFDGLEALRLLRERYPRVPFLLVSGAISDEVAAACMRGGADDYLLKDRLSRLPTALYGALERRQAEARYRLLFESVPLATWVFDLESLRFLAVNPAAVALYGWSADEFAGLTLREIRPPAELPRLEQAIRALREGTETTGPWLHCRKDGRVLEVEVTSRRLPFEGREAVLSVVHDATSRRRLERQLGESQKMEALGRLAGGIAHDFNNVLAAISGLAAIGLETAQGEAAEMFDEINGTIRRTAGLIRQLLTFSRRQPAAPRLLSLNAVIQERELMIRRLLGRGITLETRLAPELSQIRADPSQLEQVLLNLVINARDAMPAGGCLLIETRETGGAEGRPPDGPARAAVLRVSDTGDGMSEEVRGRLFEPFFTTKETGTGLGLASVYGVVSQAGGRISVSSAEGRGSVFEISLPVSGSEEA